MCGIIRSAERLLENKEELLTDHLKLWAGGCVPRLHSSYRKDINSFPLSVHSFAVFSSVLASWTVSANQEVQLTRTVVSLWKIMWTK